MFSSLWFRAIAIVITASLAVVAGLYFFAVPVAQQIAVQSAEHVFTQNKLNVLVLGYQDDEKTTDSIILAHLDLTRRTATLVSIPRDTWVAIPHLGNAKINAAYEVDGAKSSAGVVSTLLGGPHIDTTIALEPEGAAQIVDALGGLNVDVDEDMDYDDNYGALHIHLKKGEQFLTGSQVVGYMRFRHDAASDFGRVRRQQQVAKLMIDQLSQPQNWAKLPRILQFARKDVKTPLDDRKLAALLEIYRYVPDENVRTFTLPGKPGWVGDASVVFVDPRWAATIGRILFAKTDPPQDNVLVANATGDAAFDKTIVGALRGAGWNVGTFVDQPPRDKSIVIGTSPTAKALAKLFALSVQPGKQTTLLLGSDLAPNAP
jgi:LCP family protein required for cell wall assembly